MYIDKEFIQKNFLVAAEDLASHKKAATNKEALTAQQKTSLNEGGLEEYNDDPEAAFRKIERLLSVRDRSVTEITNRLQRDRFTEQALNEAIDRALRCGYLDDERFADGFIRSRLRAQKGINGIVRDLKNHRIDAYSIPGFPDQFLEEQGSQLENALRLLERKPPRAKNQKQAAYAKLIRNGFSSAIASSAVKAWVAQQQQSA